jgi:hypothetical protein
MKGSTSLLELVGMLPNGVVMGGSSPRVDTLWSRVEGGVWGEDGDAPSGELEQRGLEWVREGHGFETSEDLVVSWGRLYGLWGSS